MTNKEGKVQDTFASFTKPTSKKLIKASQGVHIVLDKKFLDGPHAIMVPQTSDGRVLFAVPWNESVI